ncbi:hypothetical protein ColTof4_04145 [Colletotrichum tofieldiae]|nr:hypothetical protein ColTof3_13994 [Colletotrichum tofieldiae]GKT71722.1 hypothetical protein ColTof4_04145 [Colletotrichum tofieldiae]
MVGFADTVDSLLETYSKCSSLLKGLKGTNNGKQPQELRKSIRSDRSKVRTVYSSRLSVAGSDLEKGDAAARSSLRKIIKRLTAAMIRLLHLMTRGQKPVIDYPSLKTLSNSSRIDAVKTINDLSRRLSAPALKSTSPGSVGKSKRQKRANTSGKASKSKDKEHSGLKLLRGREKDELQKALPCAMDVPVHLQQVDAKKRMSMATISSGSTKLGEITPNRLRRRQLENLGASDEFVVQPTYPLRPYHQPEAKQKRFWKIFGRG